MELLLPLQVARAQRVFGRLSSEHSVKRLRSKAFRMWREYVAFSKKKSVAVMKAVSYWAGRNLTVSGRAQQLPKN